MTEREKMIEIVLDTEITGIKLRNITGGMSTANAIADALIAAGFGDVSWWERKCKLCEEDWFLQKKQIEHYAESYKEMLQEDLDKYKHRAEVAERKYMIALNKYAKCDRKLNHYNKMTTTYDKEITKQAEKELAEEKNEEKKRT